MPDFEARSSASFISSKEGETPVSLIRPLMNKSSSRCFLVSISPSQPDLLSREWFYMRSRFGSINTVEAQIWGSVLCRRKPRKTFARGQDHMLGETVFPVD